MKTNTKPITEGDIESAEIYLRSGCDALSAIANAIEVLSTYPQHDELRVLTITRLAAHAAYLADTLQNDVGCFIDQVKESA